MTDQELQIAEKKPVPAEKGEFTREGVYFTPAVDIYETAKDLIMLVDMPGVDNEHVDIDLKNDVLSLVGRVEAAGEKGRELLAEYRTGNYFRSFRITDVIDQSKISASMADGVLKLTLPKAEKAVPRKIAISTG